MDRETIVEKVKLNLPDDFDHELRTVQLSADGSCCTGTVMFGMEENKFKIESVSISFEDQELSTFIREKFQEFKDNISFEDSIDVQIEPALEIVEDEMQIYTEFKIDLDEDHAKTWKNVLADSAPSKEDLREVEASIAYEKEHHDFTIHFATNNPHQYWLNCDTLEEYFEMVVENNDDMTMEEIRSKDEYYAHTHNVKEDVKFYLEEFKENFVESKVTTSYEVHPRRVSIDYREDPSVIKASIRVANCIS